MEYFKTFLQENNIISFTAKYKSIYRGWGAGRHVKQAICFLLFACRHYSVLRKSDSQRFSALAESQTEAGNTHIKTRHEQHFLPAQIINYPLETIPCWYQTDTKYWNRIAFLNQLCSKNIWRAPRGCATKKVSKDGQSRCLQPLRLWKWDCDSVGIICNANSAAEMFPKVCFTKPHSNQMPRAETRGEQHDGLQETVMWET